jgi:hypothetical protein
MSNHFPTKVILITCITILLSSCTTFIKPPTPLVRAGTGDAFQVALAMNTYGGYMPVTAK